ncbi:MAG: hypothetical protein GF372_04470 [Candidatus Marinimicrobia bacterium]|nr:hypothetical protein [Candidatus Neomarinimicrobiota bacterium]
MAEIIFNIKTLPIALKYRLLYISAFFVIGLIISWFLLKHLYPGIHFLNWFFAGLFIQAYQVWEISRFLHLNRSENNAEIYNELGAGTVLTLFRGFLLSIVGGFVFIAAELPLTLIYSIALLYTFAALSDRVDGYLARIKNHTTVFGREIDMRLDALGILLLSVLAWQFGKIGGWYILVGLSYYIFAATTWIRQKKRLKTYPLSESRHRRVLAGMQMGLLAVCIWPIFTPPATSLAAIVFGVPLLVTFFRDFLVMTGKIHLENSLYANLYSVGERLFFNGIIPGLRVLLFIFFCYYVFWDTNFYHNFSHFMHKMPLPEFIRHSQFVELSMLFSVGAITAGLLARVAALYILLLTAIFLSAGFTEPLLVIALIISASIVIYGAGKHNIWNPEDAILQRKDGEQKPE